MVYTRAKLQFCHLAIVWQSLLLFMIAVKSEKAQHGFVDTVGPLFTQQLQNPVLGKQIDSLQEPTTQTHETEELLADLQQRHSKLFNDFQTYSGDLPTNVQFGPPSLLRKIQLVSLAPHSTVEVAQDFDKLQRKLDELKDQLEAMNLLFEKKSVSKEPSKLLSEKAQNLPNVEQRPSFIKRIMSYIRPGLRGPVPHWPFWLGLNGTGVNTAGQDHSASYIDSATDEPATMLSAEELLKQLTRQRAHLDDIIKRLEFTSTNRTSLVN